MLTVLTVVIAVILWWLYHKIFSIVYFDLTKGCLFEILGCLLGGVLLAALIMKYWFLSVPVIAGIAFLATRKK